jgi:hypothetical protein
MIFYQSFIDCNIKPLIRFAFKLRKEFLLGQLCVSCDLILRSCNLIIQKHKMAVADLKHEKGRR